MKKDRRAVARDPHVRLDAVRPEAHRRVERPERVLDLLGVVAAMRQDEHGPHRRESSSPSTASTNTRPTKALALKKALLTRPTSSGAGPDTLRCS